MTNKLVAIILLTLFFQVNTWAQNLYYYSGGQKNTLFEDRSSVIIHYIDGVSPSQQLGNQAFKSFKNTKSLESKHCAILNFDQLQNISAKSLSTKLTLDKNLVKGISYAVQLDDGTQLWPTNQILLELKAGRQLSELEGLMKEYGAEYVTTSFNNMVILETREIDKTLALANRIYESQAVKWAHPDFIMEFVQDIKPDNPLPVLTPNDPLYGEQFQMHNTGQTIDGFQGTNDMDSNAPEAWDISRGSSSIVVAVIDDGVESHEDLGTVLTGYDAVTNTSGGQPGPSDAHGQACAGIIAALHNNLGVAGLAPNVQILPVRGLDGGSGSFADLAECINWATNNGADVLSNSWGSSGCSGIVDVMENAISNAVTNGRSGKGCVVVFASGNSQQCNNCVGYPARNSNVLAVGAFGNDGDITTYSQRGSELDLVAPSIDGYYQNAPFSCSGFVVTGAGVRTIDREGSAGYSSGNYTTGFGGTSAACPVVSGVAALVLSIDPNLTQTQVRDILTNTAIDMGSAGFDNTYGHGRVNAFAAVQQAQGGGGSPSDTLAPSTPSNLSSSNVTATTVDLSWTASTDNVGVTGYRIYVNNTSFTTTTGTSTQLTGLSANTSYSIYVTAYDAASNESTASNTVSVTTTNNADTQAPSSPTNLSSSNVTQTTINLSWAASSDNVGVTGYRVYVNNASFTTTTGTSTQLTGLTANTSYSIYVTAYDAASNESAASNTINVTTQDGGGDGEEEEVEEASNQAVSQVQETFELYPNPVSNSLHIRHAEPIQSIKITSVQGKVIQELKSSNKYLDVVDLSSLQPGLYIIVIESEEKNEYKRLFKR